MFLLLHEPGRKITLMGVQFSSVFLISLLFFPSLLPVFHVLLLNSLCSTMQSYDVQLRYYTTVL
jgi:hypothetical protein